MITLCEKPLNRTPNLTFQPTTACSSTSTYTITPQCVAFNPPNCPPYYVWSVPNTPDRVFVRDPPTQQQGFPTCASMYGMAFVMLSKHLTCVRLPCVLLCVPVHSVYEHRHEGAQEEQIFNHKERDIGSL